MTSSTTAVQVILQPLATGMPKTFSRSAGSPARRPYVEIVPFVGDLRLHLHHQVAQQHLVVALAPVVRVGRRAALPAFEAFDDRLGFGGLRQLDRFEQRLRRSSPSMPCRPRACRISSDRWRRIPFPRAGCSDCCTTTARCTARLPRRDRRPRCRCRRWRSRRPGSCPSCPSRSTALGRWTDRQRVRRQDHVGLRLADLQDERAVIRRVQRHDIVARDGAAGLRRICLNDRAMSWPNA